MKSRPVAFFCSCCQDKPPRKGGRYCTKCHNAKMREWRKTHPIEGLARKKQNCRAYTHQLIKRGKLTKGPCEVCGSPEVESHHDDYDQPRNVRWFCKAHHRALHKAAPAQNPRLR